MINNHILLQHDTDAAIAIIMEDVNDAAYSASHVLARVLAPGGGMVQLEALIELKFVNSSFSSSKFSIQACRAYPLVEY